MISRVRIQNILLIDDMSLVFGSGFNAITGDTGSGKSLILDCIKFLTGKSKMPASAIRNDSLASLVELDILLDGEIVTFKKERVVGGKISCYISGKLTSPDKLSELLEEKIDLDDQFAQQSLTEVGNHLPMLDRYLCLDSECKKIINIYAIYKNLTKLQKAQILELETSAEIIDILKKEISELDEANILPNEYSDLLAKKSDFNTYGKINATCSEIGTTISKSKMTAILRQAEVSLFRTLDSLSSSSIKSELESISEMASKANVLIESILQSCGEIEQSIEGEYSKLEDIEARIHLMKTLAKKYNTDPDNLSHLSSVKNNQILHYEALSSRVSETQKEIEKISAKYHELAEIVSNKRKNGALTLQAKVVEICKELKMEHLLFVVSVENDCKKISKNGYDVVTFLADVNQSGNLSSVAKAFSGGELSRLMLAFKLILAKPDQTIIFDEIDSGVSGGVALAMGRKMLETSKGTQIIAITHSHYIAICANDHILINKNQNHTEQAICSAKKLEGEERFVELAKMIGYGLSLEKEIDFIRHLWSEIRD